MFHGKPVVILDVDDVVARCVHGMIQEMNAKFGTSLTEEDLRTWDLTGTWGAAEVEHIREMMHKKGWCAALEPFPGAVEGVGRLREVAEVFFCTSPFMGEYWPHERRVWLMDHFKIEDRRIIQTEAKFLVRGELLVDDKPDHCYNWLKYQPGRGMAVLWDRPHNRDDHELPRLKSWDQVYKVVTQMVELGIWT